MLSLSNSNKTIVFLIFSLALTLRLLQISSHGIWSDEKTSILIAQGISPTTYQSSDSITHSKIVAKNTFANVIQSTVQDNGNSVAYNILLHLWTNIFGTSDLSARLISFLFSMATLILIFLFSLKRFGAQTAILTLLLFSTNALSIAYSNEARGYSMGIFFTLTATVIYWKFVFDEKINKPLFKVLLYGVSAGLALLSHYLTGVIFLGHAIYAVIFLRKKESWKYLFMGGLITSSIFMFWMLNGGLEGLEIMKFQKINFYQKMFEPNNTYVVPPTTQNIITGILQLWLQEMGNFFQAFFRVRQIAFMLIFPISVIIFVFLKKTIDFKKGSLFLLIFLTHTFFALFQAFSDGYTISFQAVYSNFAAPHFIILYSIALFSIFQLNKKIGVTLIILQLIIQSVSVAGFYTDIPRYREANPYPEIAKNILKEGEKNGVIYCDSWHDINMLSLYLPSNKEFLYVIDHSNPDYIFFGSNKKIISQNLKNRRY